MNGRQKKKILKDAPQTVGFDCDLKIEAAEGKTPRFSGIAYTGGKMNLTGFKYPVIVALDGLDIPDRSVPIRFNHDPEQGVGHADSVVVEGSSLVVSGSISRDTPAARDVAKSGKSGFPWQMSIGARVIDMKFVPKGRTVQANGRVFDGPVYVALKSSLGEISFVDYGADDRTEARIAASAAQNEDGKMDEKLKMYIEARGFTVDELTEEQIQAMEKDWKESTKEVDPPKKVEAKADEDDEPSIKDQIRAQALSETKRIAEIHKAADGNAEIEAKAIEEDWDANRTELEVLRDKKPATPAIHAKTQEADKNIIEAAAGLTGGISEDILLKAHGEEVMDKASKFRGIGIQAMMRMAARTEGIELPEFTGKGGEFIRAAISTLSVPNILSNVANKSLLEGYNFVDQTWKEFVKTASVNDFKQHTRIRMTSDFKFLPVGPDGELKHGEVSEDTFTNQADTLGRMFGLSRKNIIDDDLGAFMAIPQRLGMGAGEAIVDAVYVLLLSNPSDFFDADNNNYAEGAITALSIDSLTAAEQLFMEQTKANGRPVGIAPRLILVPPGLKVTAENIHNSRTVNETTTANKPKPVDNPHTGKFAVISSAYLSNTSITGYSSLAWYLFAAPQVIAAMEVAFLNGIEQPTVEQAEANFNTLGIEFRGYLDFGVAMQDYRGAVKMKGEA